VISVVEGQTLSHITARLPGEINTPLVYCSNSVGVAIATNSDLPGGFDYDAVITSAMADLLDGK
jgi:hypothetical protein